MRPLKMGHKNQRESSEVKAFELNELRKENLKLKRANARLRKQLEKYMNEEAINEEEEISYEKETKEEKKSDNEFICPQCFGKEFKTLNLIDKNFLICKTCLWRQKQNG